MEHHEASAEVVVDVPVWLAYDLWSAIEELPRFLGDLHRVEPLDAGWSRWDGVVGGRPVSASVETTDRVPHRLVAWRSDDGPWRRGWVTFTGADPGPTTVRYELGWSAPGTSGPDVLARVTADLRRFAEVALQDARADLVEELASTAQVPHTD